MTEAFIIALAAGFGSGAAVGTVFGVLLERHLRHRMLLRVIRDQDDASTGAL